MEVTDTSALSGFSVPLRHPAAVTFTSLEKFRSNPEKFYSICHCLQQPIDNDLIGLEIPPGTNQISLFPVLSGKKVISSVDEINQVANELLSKPIFANVDCTYERKTTNLVVETTKTWNFKLSTVVDTNHIYIRGTLKYYFDEAKRLMEKGKKFCIKVGFSSIIRECMTQWLIPQIGHATSITVSDELDFYLTNHGKPTFIDACANPCIVVAFCPFTIFGGICYSFYRVAAVKDIFYSFTNVPAKYLTDEDAVEFIMPEFPLTLLH